jgi:hypothetical protein
VARATRRRARAVRGADGDRRRPERGGRANGPAGVIGVGGSAALPASVAEPQGRAGAPRGAPRPHRLGDRHRRDRARRTHLRAGGVRGDRGGRQPGRLRPSAGGGGRIRGETRTRSSERRPKRR